MEKCKINFKKLLGTLCILIIIIMIVRFLYIRLNNKNNNKNKIEGFENSAIDLLSKSKSFAIVSNTTFELATVINSWTTKIYNMKSPNIQTKQIALYQPTLLINSVQYCKLGDMLSQNKNYKPPIANQNTLLIKSSSDIKPPIDYELVVNFGEEYVNTKYYRYESFINNIDTMNLIKPSINVCANIVRDINNLIKNVITTSSPDVSATTNINNNNNRNPIPFKSILTAAVKVPMDDYLISNRYNDNYPYKYDTKLNYTYNKLVNVITNEMPAGVSGSFNIDYYYNYDDNFGKNTLSVPFTVPFGIDGATPDECVNIFNAANPNLLTGTYQLQSKITSKNFSGAKTPSTSIFKMVPIMPTIDYLTMLCNQINIIYDNNNTNQSFLTFLQLVNNKETISDILAKIESCKDFISAYDNINTITVKDKPDIAPSFDAIITAGASSGSTTLIGKLFEFMRDSKTSYTPSTFRIYGDQIPTFPSNFVNIGRVGLIKYTSITYNQFTSFGGNSYTNNSFNILSDKYNIQPVINNLLDFNKFILDLQSNNIKNLPLKIYKPIPPPGYVSIGHVFCNIQLQLKNIKDNAAARTGICCIPDNCIKEMKDWNVSDKVFEYSKDDVYWALYYNKYTGTFVSTNKNQLPVGKMCKVIACVTKCTAVDELQKSDKCARNYYNINKSLSNEAKSPSDLLSDQEEEYYLAKLKAQSDNLTRLSNRAHQMELDIDKANIVNREMNKNKLHSYVDKQKVNIDLILQRLIKDKDSIQTNINIPQSLLDKLLDMIKNLKDMSDDDKLKLISKLLKKSCPDTNLAGLVKKQLVSDVCYGCDNV